VRFPFAAISRIVLLSLIVLAPSAILAQAGQAGQAEDNPIAEFWSWFASQAARVKEGGDDAENREAMAYWLGRIRPGLSYQILQRGRKAELVLTADGQIALFGTVAAVARAAPKIKGWKITALRAKTRKLSTVRIGDAAIDPATTWFDLYQDSARLGVVFYLPEFQGEHIEDYRKAARVLMCQAVGERNVGNEIGFVDIDSRDVRDAQFSRPFTDFSTVFNGLRR